jgi:hypothetical protein
LPAPAVLDRILACTDEAWAAASVSRDGFSLDGDAFEVEARLP